MCKYNITISYLKQYAKFKLAVHGNVIYYSNLGNES